MAEENQYKWEMFAWDTRNIKVSFGYIDDFIECHINPFLSKHSFGGYQQMNYEGFGFLQSFWQKVISAFGHLQDESLRHEFEVSVEMIVDVSYLFPSS
jgi:hypothetical protein